MLERQLAGQLVQRSEHSVGTVACAIIVVPEHHASGAHHTQCLARITQDVAVRVRPVHEDEIAPADILCFVEGLAVAEQLHDARCLRCTSVAKGSEPRFFQRVGDVGSVVTLIALIGVALVGSERQRHHLAVRRHVARPQVRRLARARSELESEPSPLGEDRQNPGFGVARTPRDGDAPPSYEPYLRIGRGPELIDAQGIVELLDANLRDRPRPEKPSLLPLPPQARKMPREQRDSCEKQEIE